MCKANFLLCILTLSFLTVQPSEHPFDVPTEFIEKFPELIWLKELYLCAKIESQINQDEIDKAVIFCDQCNAQLCCSNLGGILSSQRDQKNLGTLKQLMTIGDGLKIAEFMLPLCNQLQIECSHCHIFAGWHANQKNA
ncbi:MAG: hypothetical protein WC747_04210 [Candidatus Babeliales bacterium]|jgi:hypothetical protein